MQRIIPALFAFIILLAACGSREPQAQEQPVQDSYPARGPVLTGAQVMENGGFRSLKGRRVGLVVNHTARTDSGHIIDRMIAAGVHVSELFAPEHGLRGEAEAGAEIRDGRDTATGIRVYSLHGETRKPTPAMLRNVDVLVFDMQDVGARFYTYISTMGLAMQAAAEADIPFIVLDRPNPAGGNYVSGFVMEEAYQSFLGQYPIPIAHGMTVGELARLIKGDKLLPGLENLKLSVVPMKNYTREMRWEDTGLPWIPPSPNLPTSRTALAYLGTCLIEGTGLSEGRGTEAPFLTIGAPGLDVEKAIDLLEDAPIKGARFSATTAQPRAIRGKAEDPKFQNKQIPAVQIAIEDPHAYQPVEAGIYLLDALYRSGAAPLFNKPDALARLAGTQQLGADLKAGKNPAAIILSYKSRAESFEGQRRPYLLY